MERICSFTDWNMTAAFDHYLAKANDPVKKK